MGPVSGVEQKVPVHDDKGHMQYDYVARPDYHFEYGVEDPKSMVHQSRQETREGDVVHGEYRCCAKIIFIASERFYRIKCLLHESNQNMNIIYMKWWFLVNFVFFVF